MKAPEFIEGEKTPGKVCATGVAEVSMLILDTPRPTQVMPHLATHAASNLIIQGLPDPDTYESWQLSQRGIIRCTYEFILPDE